MFSRQRSMGQYGTPPETVEYMVQTLSNHLPDNRRNPEILDPATGDGVFVYSLLKEGFSPSQIHAYDIDTATPSPHEGITFRHVDFLKVELEEKFDAIVGNPPYKSKRQSDYFTENKKAITARYGGIGVHNLYSLFIHNGIKLLKPGGVLTMIVQDSFLTNVYYRKFRAYLLEKTIIKEIVLAPRRLFHKGKADVRTAILTLKKKEGNERQEDMVMKLVDRLETQEYQNITEDKIQYLKQAHFHDLPNNNFAVNVPEEILAHFLRPHEELGNVLKGGTGISTGNDTLFLRRREDVKDDQEWLPFYKNGGVKDAWYYEPKFYIHKDWEDNEAIYPSFTVRNRAYFYRRGITCSSMGVDFSAAYLPENSLFGVNANLFPENEEDLFYYLGLLNSQLIKYMVRKVLNRTNMITSGYIKKIPYVLPAEDKKHLVIQTTKQLVEGKKADPQMDTALLHSIVDGAIYDIYGISGENRTHVESFCQDILEKI
ncbi:UNVERIFIED_CONTAM: N-6 DNA methylase [Halobacillus marinus]|uniref:Eco57I restriction-modification methylase domain-containing protein n=1 Tax=Halobacillus sp. BAB-2008 TaxID=1246484 RepID=UPI0002A4F8DF|nr:N-6 DNA methylase [Halobacillus sp. BAB-2008]ELK48188.1 hypothetical protein D479_03743 [Halobacillus sp. BAB-2008]